MQVHRNSQSLNQEIRRSCIDKIQLKNQIVKLALFLLVVIIVASITITGEVSYDQEYYFLQNKIINKHTRGIFPPLSGKSSQIFGSWKFLIQIGQQQSNLEIFKSYTLTFQKRGNLNLIKESQNCTQSTKVQKYSWKTFSFNINIIQKIVTKKQTTQPKSIKINQQDDGLSINSEDVQEDLPCFGQDEDIFKYIQNFTVWTFAEGKLYLMSEIKGQGKVSTSIFVLQKINK